LLELTNEPLEATDWLYLQPAEVLDQLNFTSSLFLHKIPLSLVLRSLLTASSYDDDISYVTLAGSDGEALENFLCLCYTGKTLPFETGLYIRTR